MFLSEKWFLWFLFREIDDKSGSIFQLDRLQPGVARCVRMRGASEIQWFIYQYLLMSLPWFGYHQLSFFVGLKFLKSVSFYIIIYIFLIPHAKLCHFWGKCRCAYSSTMEHLGMGTPQNLVCRDFILSSRKPKIFLDLFGHWIPLKPCAQHQSTLFWHVLVMVSSDFVSWCYVKTC